MRYFFVLVVLLNSGCLEQPPSQPEPPCFSAASADATSQVSYPQNVEIEMLGCHAYLDEKLIVTLNDRVLINEELPAEEEGEHWLESRRERNTLWLNPYDKYDNRLSHFFVGVYTGICSFTDEGGIVKTGRNLIAREEFWITDTYVYGGCGPVPAARRPQQIYCGPSKCEEIP